jgi:hypothetical protein
MHSPTPLHSGHTRYADTIPLGPRFIKGPRPKLVSH